jgi:hypothetical protein
VGQDGREFFAAKLVPWRRAAKEVLTPGRLGRILESIGDDRNTLAARNVDAPPLVANNCEADMRVTNTKSDSDKKT